MRARHGLDFAAGAAAGARELLAHGCTTVADISHDNSAWPALKPLPIRKVCFAEVLGVGPPARGALPRALRSIDAATPDARLRFGLSPHAPYSTAEPLYRRTVAAARQRGLPITTHLAESRQERHFLRTGRGMFAAFLARLGLTHAPAPAATFTEFAARVGLLGAARDVPVLLAHGQHFTRREYSALADAGVSLAYCPRSTAWFGRAGHPYVDMLAAGINVCLGTDSLASNDSLDVLAEMRAVRAEGRIDDATIVRMATANGAAALGMNAEIGTLTPGKWADWLAVPVRAGSDALEQVLTGNAGPARVAIAGETVS
jgi:cytosine/adenosine deaminase-related metal-dependent hydrolase